MLHEQLIEKIKELKAQNPEAMVETLPAYQQLLVEYANSQVSSAVKAEKDKLYGTIEDFKKKNGELSSKNAELSTKVTDYTSKFEDLTKKVETFIAPETPKQKELTAQQVAELNKQQQAGLTPEQVNDMLDKKFNDELPNIIQNSLKPLMDVQSNLQQSTLADYKNARLKELGDAVIPEMISGTTKEEIESSIEASKQVRARFTTPDTTTNQTPPTPQTPQVMPPTPTSVTPTPPSSSALGQMKSMSNMDFAKNREQLLNELKGSIAQ